MMLLLTLLFRNTLVGEVQILVIAIKEDGMHEACNQPENLRTLKILLN